MSENNVCGMVWGFPAGEECEFCNLPTKKILGSTQHWSIIADEYPVNLGHMLIVLKRHMASSVMISGHEASDLFVAMNMARAYAREKYKAVGFNIGINEGEVAGQTVGHLHVHIIPRYEGDVENPRGGIRNFKKAIKSY